MGKPIKVSRATYAEVLREPRCHLCGHTLLELEGETWVVDHLVPRSLGGCDHRSNLRKAHSTCNRWRGDKALTEALYDHVAKRRRVALFVEG
jgi:5-methylcytosine-specific restriction endonuclease McrA